MMHQSGLREEDVLRRAFEAMRTGQLPPGMSMGHSHAPPGHGGGGCGHAHGGHGGSHGGHGHSHGSG